MTKKENPVTFKDLGMKENVLENKDSGRVFLKAEGYTDAQIDDFLKTWDATYKSTNPGQSSSK